jgi:hypothetical protein
MRKLVATMALAVVLQNGSARADYPLVLPMTPPESGHAPSAEWCAGWNTAIDAVMANRNHYRALLNLDHETHDQTMSRLKAGEPQKTPELGKELVDSVARLVADGVDLYVVLPQESKCSGGK